MKIKSFVIFLIVINTILILPGCSNSNKVDELQNQTIDVEEAVNKTIPTSIPTSKIVPLPTTEQIAVIMEPISVTIKCYDYNNELASTGSGFFINNDYIVTNYHVIEGLLSNRVVAVLNNGAEYEIDKVINYDIKRDLFIFSINYSNNKFVKFGDSSSIAIGNSIYISGSPLGVSNTVTEGTISNKSIIKDSLIYIQISTQIPPGSSGGALINKNGEVIGITMATQTKNQSMNLAIPINELKNLLIKDQLNISFENFDRGPINKIEIYANGCYYIGTFSKGLRDGYGSYYYADGSVFEGNWIDGMKTGYGTFYWINGDLYEGNYLENMKTGYGTFNYANGSVYVGHFVNDYKQGKGSYTWVNGTSKTGTWFEDKYIGN